MSPQQENEFQALMLISYRRLRGLANSARFVREICGLVTPASQQIAGMQLLYVTLRHATDTDDHLAVIMAGGRFFDKQDASLTDAITALTDAEREEYVARVVPAIVEWEAGAEYGVFDEQ